MSDNYTILHLHSMDSNPYSGVKVDSTVHYQKYIDEAVKCKMKAIAFTEHGCVLHNIGKKQACDKAGLKYIHAEEFYITESLSDMKRDNYHCCLFARNHKGVKELNHLSSISMNKDDGHFYYNPRITIDELLATSDNILVSTACLAGILSKGTDSIKKKFLQFIIKNKHRCWLEIQPHNFDRQIDYNKLLVLLYKKYSIKIIATSDIHAITQKQLKSRELMQRGKNTNFNDIKDEIECDLKFKNYSQLVESFEIQNAVPKEIYMDAIEETNRFADLIEPYDLDYSPKYPRLYENPIGEFKKRIVSGIKEHRLNTLPNYKTEYMPRIKEEFNTYKKNDAIDFMLLDSDYKNWMRKNKMRYGISRGSVSGSLIAYLLHNTEIDSVKYKLNFSRFMNPERQSLADIDTDIYKEDRYKVREYFFNREGLYCCNIVTFNTLGLRSAIKDIGRAYGLTPAETQSICDSIQKDENEKEYVPEQIIKQHEEMFEYVYEVIGVVTSLGRHAAGIVCSPTDISYDFATLSIKEDNRPVSQIDMHEIDSLNYVKMDLLGLNAVGLIYKACDLAGIEYKIPENTDFNDKNVIESIAEDTTMIFQFESGYSSDCLKKALSPETINKIKQKNKDASYIDIISMTSGAIRPAGESYREQLFNGEYKDNGNAVLNDFLAPTLGFCVYQEQIIDFLHEFCDFRMGQADIVRRGFSKKLGTEKYIPIIKNGGYMEDIHGNQDDRYIKGFISIAQEKYNMKKEDAEIAIKDFLDVIESASSYLFSRNHAVPYSMTGYIIGWLRYYYPLELFTAALNVYKDNAEKIASIKEYIRSKGFQIKNIKFGKSKAEYFMDKSENSIYQGIENISYCNTQIADELFKLSKNKYDSFIELLDDITSKTSVNISQLHILTGLDFFSDYGKNKKLLKVIDLYNGVKEKSKTILPSLRTCNKIKKVKIESYSKFGLSEFLIKKYSEKETAAQYSKIDNIGLLNEMCNRLPEESMTLQENAKFQKEYLSFVQIDSALDVDENYYMVIDFKVYKDKSRPYLTLQNLHDGTKIKSRIKSSRVFTAKPFDEMSILSIPVLEMDFKKKCIDGEWKETKELEYILTNYEVVNV